jgi:hypothetical protein
MKKSSAQNALVLRVSIRYTPISCFARFPGRPIRGSRCLYGSSYIFTLSLGITSLSRRSSTRTFNPRAIRSRVRKVGLLLPVSASHRLAAETPVRADSSARLSPRSLLMFFNVCAGLILSLFDFPYV